MLAIDPREKIMVFVINLVQKWTVWVSRFVCVLPGRRRRAVTMAGLFFVAILAGQNVALAAERCDSAVFDLTENVAVNGYARDAYGPVSQKLFGKFPNMRLVVDSYGESIKTGRSFSIQYFNVFSMVEVDIVEPRLTVDNGPMEGGYPRYSVGLHCFDGVGSNDGCVKKTVNDGRIEKRNSPMVSLDFQSRQAAESALRQIRKILYTCVKK